MPGRVVAKSILRLTNFGKDSEWARQFALVAAAHKNGSSKLADSDVDAVGAYFGASQKHQDMIDRYWPTSNLTPEEKLKRTANTVGFDLPKSVPEGTTSKTPME